MTDPRLQITFRDCDPSEFAERSVQEHFAKLAELGMQIDSAHAVLSIPHQHQHKGNHQCVHLQINVPGRTFVVDRDPDSGPAAQDMYHAIADAFARARRLLVDHKQRSSRAAHR